MWINLKHTHTQQTHSIIFDYISQETERNTTQIVLNGSIIIYRINALHSETPS